MSSFIGLINHCNIDLIESHQILFLSFKCHKARQQFSDLSSFAGSHFRLKAASQEAETVRREQAVWERKVGELQARCTTLEEEKYEALSKVRESVQVVEEAILQKDQVRVALSLCSLSSRV